MTTTALHSASDPSPDPRVMPREGVSQSEVELRAVFVEANLTEREAQAYSLCNDGKTFKDIAPLFHCSPSQVSKAYHSACRKIANRGEWHGGLDDVRALNILHKMGIESVEQVVSAIADGRLAPGRVKYFGRRTFHLLEYWLRQKGVAFPKVGPNPNNQKIRIGKPCIDMHFVRMDWNREKKKHDRITEERTVTLMAIAGNYAMVRRKGCMPYVASLKDLRHL